MPASQFYKALARLENKHKTPDLDHEEEIAKLYRFAHYAASYLDGDLYRFAARAAVGELLESWETAVGEDALEMARKDLRYTIELLEKLEHKMAHNDTGAKKPITDREFIERLPGCNIEIDEIHDKHVAVIGNMDRELAEVIWPDIEPTKHVATFAAGDDKWRLYFRYNRVRDEIDIYCIVENDSDDEITAREYRKEMKRSSGLEAELEKVCRQQLVAKDIL